ncbi:MAG TPA: hypothetical protein VLN48_18285 [Bryobacteraceae bacterium]|nr:hypothetical protein [Bryobacteraceae bacterium]
MPPWSENYSASSLEEVLQKQAENRAWSKELRRKANVLVNSRLSNDITLADYLASRKLGHEESAECRRRANLIDLEITRCSVEQYTMAHATQDR